VSGPLDTSAGRIRLAVRLQPGASSDEVVGVALDAAGCAFLRVRVTQPPEGGKANRALVRLLARALRLPPSSIALAAGHKERRKTLEFAGGREVAQRIGQWLGSMA